MEEIIQDFIQETIEILESLDKDLVILEETPNDTELLNRIFRSIHTVKGTSGFLGFERLTSVAHKTEDILNKLRKEDIKLTHRLMDLILIGVDGVKVLFGEIQEDGTEKAEIEETVMRLEQGLMEESLKQSQGEEESGIVPVPDLKVSEPPSTPQESPAEKAPVKEETPKEAPKMLGELLVEKNLVSEQDILEASKEQKKLGEILVEKNLLEKEQLDAVLAEQREAQAKNFKNKTEGQTIRVDVDRLDNLLNQVGELVFERNRLIDMVKKLSSGDGSEGHGQLGDKLGAISDDLNFITGQLQMSVLKMRMIPIGRVFNKFPRVVRDLSRKIEKEVELIISGEETELDKSVIEELGDPLTHIVRNSIDHGLETPEEREALGKPRKGRIWLTASQEGSFIIISIKDDGRGINLEAVKKKALEKGIVSADKLKTLTNSEIINFIFAPGFSTAKVVTDVSGRGVGMDVVRTNIKKINGSIDVKSVPGQGTEMILKLPLTLAIIQSLLVTVGQERFAIPLAVVVETLKINKSEIKTIERQEVLKLRNEVLSLLRMADFYKVETSKELENPYIVIVKAAERKLGLIVDTLLGQEEIVIKPLGELLKDTKGISGATIMGDGLVTLIVDIATLVGEQRKIL
ncbi:MAG TPA: chemotaxis protein CheA [Candidatus Aminicenantes bacterium]|nr:chemotaxis protein CheA [Candidatus Aminicenantes bacterium]HPS99603.1 chemotaxis protein CheA [Candidatus Aminicenantes bacterium]